MPRKPNPNAPGRGNRSVTRGKPPVQRVVIEKDIARALRDYAPDIQVQQLVNALLVEFLGKFGYPPPPPKSETLQPTETDQCRT